MANKKINSPNNEDINNKNFKKALFRVKLRKIYSIAQGTKNIIIKCYTFAKKHLIEIIFVIIVFSAGSYVVYNFTTSQSETPKEIIVTKNDQERVQFLLTKAKTQYWLSSATNVDAQTDKINAETSQIQAQTEYIGKNFKEEKRRFNVLRKEKQYAATAALLYTGFRCNFHKVVFNHVIKPTGNHLIFKIKQILPQKNDISAEDIIQKNSIQNTENVHTIEYNHFDIKRIWLGLIPADVDNFLENIDSMF